MLYREADVLEALSVIPPSLKVYFAVQACYRPPVLQALARAGVGAEVMSLNELALAESAGFRGRDILCNGLGRPAEMLERAVVLGATVILDSLADLETLQRVLRGFRGRFATARVGVRLKPEVPTEYGRRPHKLGFPRGPELIELLRRIAAHPGLQLETLHAQAASEERSLEVYRRILRQLVRLRRELETLGQGPITTLDVGGGFAAWKPTERARWTRFFAGLAAAAPPGVQVAIEPGRFLVDSAGSVCATVTAVKQLGERHYVVVDAGTNGLMPFQEPACRLLAPRGRHEVSVVDGITSLTSVIVEKALVKQVPRVGEQVWLGGCGAYTSALSSFWVYDPFPVSFQPLNGEPEMDLTRAQIEGARRLLLRI